MVFLREPPPRDAGKMGISSYINLIMYWVQGGPDAIRYEFNCKINSRDINYCLELKSNRLDQVSKRRTVGLPNLIVVIRYHSTF
jgi:hypothetical protein